MGWDEGGQDVVAAVAGGAVTVAPAVVGREEVVQGRQKVFVAASAGFQDGDAGSGVRNEDVQQAVAAVCRLSEEGCAVGSEVGDGLRRACGDVEDAGGECGAHAFILVRTTCPGPQPPGSLPQCCLNTPATMVHEPR